MIGHLQRNKVKYLVGKVQLIHSVDSLRLAEQIEKEFAKADEIANVLIEVNMAQEESKFGITSQETEELIREIAKLPHVRIQGLMTIAPFTDNPETNRVYFKNMKKLSVDINNKNIEVMEKYLIHSNELHLIDKAKIHQAVEKMVESLDMAAGSTSCFDLYKVVETYFTDLEKRKKMNQLLGITDATEEIEEEFGVC